MFTFTNKFPWVVRKDAMDDILDRIQRLEFSDIRMLQELMGPMANKYGLTYVSIDDIERACIQAGVVFDNDQFHDIAERMVDQCTDNAFHEVEKEILHQISAISDNANKGGANA